MGRNLRDEHFNQLRNKNEIFGSIRYIPMEHMGNSRISYYLDIQVNGAKDIVKIRLIDTQPEKIIVKFSHSFP